MEEKEWKEFFISDVFTEIQRGRRFKKSDQKEGKIPYVSYTGISNGVDGFIGNKERVRAFSGCLTIANSGSVGVTFYHSYKFIASDHVTELKDNSLSSYS